MTLATTSIYCLDFTVSNDQNIQKKVEIKSRSPHKKSIDKNHSSISYLCMCSYKQNFYYVCICTHIYIKEHDGAVGGFFLPNLGYIIIIILRTQRTFTVILVVRETTLFFLLIHISIFFLYSSLCIYISSSLLV